MAKLWAGRTDAQTNAAADAFNSSIGFDQRLYQEDIQGSMAHAVMLGAQGIIPSEASQHIIDGLQSILEDLDSGKLTIDPSAEDIHTFLEQELTRRIGREGKMVHTARSRNDQTALDLRLYLRKENHALVRKILQAAQALTDKAEEEKNSVMPGYTHLQHAQPVTMGHYLLAYVQMLLRDADRLQDQEKRMNVSVIGSCALAGTTYPIDRTFEAGLLGYDSVSANSLDAVSDRDFALELLSDLSILMMHLSRLCEELVLWSSWEFGFIELDDAYTTGSSIMPQKKNSDMAELIRGKTGRVYGDLVSLLTVMKGLPLSYNKDMQEDKEAVFDSLDTVKACLDILTPMISTMRFHHEKMKEAAQQGFLNATDLADYLVRKGLPFREAYKISGAVVARCIQENQTLETLPLMEYQEFSSLFDKDLYQAIDLDTCVSRRSCPGGPSVWSVETQIRDVRKKIASFHFSQ